MTRVYDASGKITCVTVIEAGGNTLLQKKTVDGKDGYNAVQVGYDTQKEHRVISPRLGQFKKAGSEPKSEAGAKEESKKDEGPIIDAEVVDEKK